MLSEKEKLEEELKLLRESFDLDVITYDEYEDAKQRIDAKLKELDISKQKEEVREEEQMEAEERKEEEPETSEKEIEIKEISEEEQESIKEEVKNKAAKEESSEVEEPGEEIEIEEATETEVGKKKPGVNKQKKLQEVKEESAESTEIKREKEEFIRKEPQIIVEEEKKSSKKIFIYAAIILLLGLGLWYSFFSGDSNAAELPDKSLLIACNSDNECIKEGSIGICLNPGKENAICEYIEDANIKLTILNTNDCFNCKTNRVLSILKSFFPNLDIENIDSETEQGKEIIEMFNINALPAYVLDSNFTESYNHDKLSSSFNKINGNFVMKNTVSNANYYISRDDTPNNLDLFIMQGQDASLKAEENLKEFLEAFEGNVNFKKYNADSIIAKQLGINTFPTFLVNNKIKFSGVQSANKIKENFCEMNKLDKCQLELSKNLV